MTRLTRGLREVECRESCREGVASFFYRHVDDMVNLCMFCKALDGVR